MGKIEDEINSMIRTAILNTVIISPRFSDYRPAEILNTDNPDLEAEIKKLFSEENESIRERGISREKVDQDKKELETVVEKFKRFDSGNVGEIQRMTSSQFGNIKGLATNPVQFMIQSVFRKLSRGIGLIGLAAVLFEVVKFILTELMKPGRLLDRRFKRDINKEILAFRSREEKQRLRQGFSNVIVTTIGGLRGGAGQITSSRQQVREGTIGATINKNFEQPGTTSLASGVNLSEGHSKRGGSVFRR